MNIRRALRIIEHRIRQNRPARLAWIDGTPAVRDEYERLQRTYWFLVLPYMAVVVAILYSFKYVGLALPGYPWSVALAMAGWGLVMCIPTYRMGVAAFRAVSCSPRDLRSRLHVLGFINLIVATLTGVSAAGFLWVGIAASGIAR